ncbi:hypothetical protein FRB94_008437 [Tulasnella sp. JGI-2019a]|nr:hypothetical protein FRB94_008437 [Tulasnella sp. JGI-2019a]
MAVNSYLQTSGWTYQGFRSVNPQCFEWTSPDPDHQFSVAIVPLITTTLSKAFWTWSKLRSLKLTNVNCLDCRPFFHLGHTTHPDLRHIHLGQSICVTPSAALFPAISLPNLEKLVLVDVYPDSIWQRRLRMADLKAAWDEMPEDGLDDIMGSWGGKPDWETVRSKIECKVERQRFSGGDHGDDMDDFV